MKLGNRQSDCGFTMTNDNLDLAQRLERIEQLLQSLIEQRMIKEWYTTAEVAKLLAKELGDFCRRVPFLDHPLLDERLQQLLDAFETLGQVQVVVGHRKPAITLSVPEFHCSSILVKRSGTI